MLNGQTCLKINCLSLSTLSLYTSICVFSQWCNMVPPSATFSRFIADTKKDKYTLAKFASSEEGFFCLNNDQLKVQIVQCHCNYSLIFVEFHSLFKGNISNENKMLHDSAASY